MNRTVEGWRTWYTQPMPNIGMFLCRGNAKTVHMFQLAWEGYQVIQPCIYTYMHIYIHTYNHTTIHKYIHTYFIVQRAPSKIKHNPGKDQNKVIDALRLAR
jgi:hypothetical protein